MYGCPVLVMDRDVIKQTPCICKDATFAILLQEGSKPAHRHENEEASTSRDDSNAKAIDLSHTFLYICFRVFPVLYTTQSHASNRKATSSWCGTSGMLNPRPLANFSVPYTTMRARRQ